MQIGLFIQIFSFDLSDCEVNFDFSSWLFPYFFDQLWEFGLIDMLSIFKNNKFCTWKLGFYSFAMRKGDTRIVFGMP